MADTETCHLDSAQRTSLYRLGAIGDADQGKARVDTGTGWLRFRSAM